MIKKYIYLFVSIAALLLIGCGANNQSPDATEIEQSNVIDKTDTMVEITPTKKVIVNKVNNTEVKSDEDESDSNTESDNNPEPDTVDPINNGIIVVKAYGKSYYCTNIDAYEATDFTINIDSIDPETGAVTHIRTFTNKDSQNCFTYITGIGGYTRRALKNFNSDMTLMTAYKILDDGAKHVGYIDENGKFTDVTEKITTESDFGGLTNHFAPCIYDEYLYFRDTTNTKGQIKRVPLNNLTEKAVEVMDDDATWNGTDICPLPDGSIIDGYDRYDYYDSSMQYPARICDTYDWISADTCLGNGNGGNSPEIIYKYKLSGEGNCFGWYDDSSTFIPEVKDRFNWNALVSPSKDKVAFLSKLQSGTGQATNLFLINIDGGEPVKVQTDYSFDGNLIGLVEWRGERSEDNKASEGSDSSDEDSATESAELNEEMEVLYRVVVTATDGFVNFRTEPGTDAEIIDQINNGVMLDIVGASDDGKWLRIIRSDKSGWISESQTTKIVEE